MKRYILTFVILGIILSSTAAPVSRDEASAMAASFLNQESVTEVKTSFESFRIFNGDDRFVIISADDCALPILGYSFSGCFVIDDIPFQIQAWLGSYDNSIRALVQNGIEASEDVIESWSLFRSGEGLPERNLRTVEPLVATRWGQRSPFNAQCPSECVTGCVATTLSQIMKYWEYPNRGNGSHSYVHPVYGEQSVNFGATIYDWDNMPLLGADATTEEEVQALSTLLYQAGVSVEMNYGPDASSASALVVADALITYFRYASSATFEMKDDYSDVTWKNMLKTELDAARPVFYGGQTDKGGHAFLCDGYDNLNLFHFNWGWNGRDDGYYQIGALNTHQGDFNVLNYAVFGIQPESFAIAAPANVSARVQNGQVNLTWDAVSGAVMYKVYRDNELVEPMVLGTSFTDIEPSYGVHVYYVKAISSTGERSPRSVTVEAEVMYQAPKPTNIEALPQGYDLVLSWDMPFEPEEELAYGTSSFSSSFGYNGSQDTYWGQRYPASMLKPYVGFTIQSVSVYFSYVGTYTLRIGKGTGAGVEEVVAQKDYTVSATGWKELVLDSPLELDCTSDLWIVMRAPQSITYPAAYTSYEGVRDASYIATSLDKIASYSATDVSWMFKVSMKEHGYTYKVLRDGSLVASGLTERSFTDAGLNAGLHDYQVWSAFNGAYSEEPALFMINLAQISLSVENPDMGTVQGAGLAEVGAYCTVKANPSPGSVFLCWKEDGTVVSTRNEYAFVVDGDRHLQACFAGVGVGEEEALTTIQIVEVFTLNGALLDRFDGDADVNHRLESYAKGVYLLKLTTDKGVVVKKVVR